LVTLDDFEIILNKFKIKLTYEEKERLVHSFPGRSHEGL
jgi:hypothetical protein